MIGTTLSYDGMGSLVLFVITDLTPGRDEWRQYVDFLKERVSQHGSARLVVVAGSGAPDSLQRQYLSEAVSPKQLRTAVISDSLVARGVVTAFRWYGLEVSAYKSSAIDDAYRYVGVTSEEAMWLRKTLSNMRAAAPPRAASR
jgi:hypothetical protein